MVLHHNIEKSIIDYCHVYQYAVYNLIYMAIHVFMHFFEYLNNKTKLHRKENKKCARLTVISTSAFKLLSNIIGQYEIYVISTVQWCRRATTWFLFGS